MFKITPPIWKNVAYGILGLLLAYCLIWLGYHDRRHNRIQWVSNRPSLYTPIFYSADSLSYYIDLAFHSDDPEALTVAGTAAYNLRVFDRAALDSLPAVELDDADMMLWRAAQLGYEPAFTVIRFLYDLDLWQHSLPTNAPTIIPFRPSPDDPDYKKM